MTQHTTTLLLGSDLGDKIKNLEVAKDLISSSVGCIVNESIMLETEPIGFTSKTMFLNQLIQVMTKLSPIQLLTEVKCIEKQMGRVYARPKNNEKYTSRIIDVDILYYDRLLVFSKVLLIPHPQIYTRKFVAELLNSMVMNG